MMEKMIVRREYDPYRKEWGFLAVYPKDPACPGRLAALPLYFTKDGGAIFEPHCEIDYGYYYGKTKLVKAKSEDAIRVREAVERYYNSNPNNEPCHFRLMEKIM